MGILIVALIIGVIVAGGPPMVDMGLALGSASKERTRAIDNNRQRKHERRMAWGDFFRKAWEDRRQRRHEKAGGTGPYKPGALTYIGELYAGFWWRKIRNLRERQGINPPPPYEPPGPQVEQSGDLVDQVSDQPSDEAGDQPAGPDGPSGGTQDSPSPFGGTQPCGICGRPTAYNDGMWRHRGCTYCASCGEPIVSSAGRTVVDNATYHPLCAPRATQPEPTTTPPAEGGDSKEEPVTAPATTPTATEVQGNEDLRQNLTTINDAAKKMADALAAVEEALASMKAAATASADGVVAKRFDQGATTAVNEIADYVSVATLSSWHGLADNASAQAQAALQALEKYRDAEDTVQSNNVDASTLESAAA